MVIKNIIFDLGGVLLDIDFGLTARAFERLGVLGFNDLFSQARQEAFFDLFEVGAMSAADFRHALRVALGSLHLSDDEVDAAWNAMLISLPRERLTFVEELKNKYQVFLFSNTNAIHLEYVQNIAEKAGVRELFDSLFHRAYYSHLYGARKPVTRTFERLLEENKLVADETLFVDDSALNLDGAKAAGMQVMHITHGRDIFALRELL